MLSKFEVHKMLVTGLYDDCMLCICPSTCATDLHSSWWYISCTS